MFAAARKKPCWTQTTPVGRRRSGNNQTAGTGVPFDPHGIPSGACPVVTAGALEVILNATPHNPVTPAGRARSHRVGPVQ